MVRRRKEERLWALEGRLDGHTKESAALELIEQGARLAQNEIALLQLLAIVDAQKRSLTSPRTLPGVAVGRSLIADAQKKMADDAEAAEAEAALEEEFEEGDEELEAMKSKVKEMEDEAEQLRKIQAQVEESMTGGEGDAEANAADARSIYVGQVDYSATPEELQEFFAECGTVNRVTILCDQWRQPKGYAYIEFAEETAVEAAVALNEAEFKGRQLKVVAKRTNAPGMRGGRGRGRGRGRGPPFGFRGRGKGKGKGGAFYRPRGRGRGYRPY